MAEFNYCNDIFDVLCDMAGGIVMIEIKCDICKEKCSPVQFYKLEETVCKINMDHIKKTDDHSYNVPTLLTEMHLCETCMNMVNGRIISLKASRQ